MPSRLVGGRNTHSSDALALIRRYDLCHGCAWGNIGMNVVNFGIISPFCEVKGVNMIGAIIGDIVGSRFEWDNIKVKSFEFFHPDCCYTDDSVMTIAVAKAILESRCMRTDLAGESVKWFQRLGRAHPRAGYGSRFYEWIFDQDPKPYGSFGNGAAMRVSACGYASETIEEAALLAHAVTGVTHDHPEGLKGAEATAVAIVLARRGASIQEIHDYVSGHYYEIDFKLADIRDTYEFDVSCQGTVPYALAAFYESTSYEDAIRNAISIGGDSDTLGAITGGIAGAYWGVPDYIRVQGLKYLSDDLREIVLEFNRIFPNEKV